MLVKATEDVYCAKAVGKVGIVFGFQNCSPIEDNVSLVEDFPHLLQGLYVQGFN